jgi:Domain of unknown function (DUF397)
MAAPRTPDMSRAVWRKSRHSANAGNCVEVAGNISGTVTVRDSKDPDGPILRFEPKEWRRFAAHVAARPA